ncbi:MAG: YdcF family protein [Lachnospiraceae bacterium]|nr:YdcF family protein [Lachnospiraceae bacterium]
MKHLNTIIRLILFLFGAAGFSGFIIPVLRRRIINIGNASGIVICICFMLYAVFLPKLHEMIRVFWQKTVGKIVLGIFAAGLVSALILVIVMTVLMVKAANTRPAASATVMVLGCKVYGERPSIMLEARLNAALEYLNANPESSCIVSGGQGSDELISEAECMYLYLTSHGIAAERIYREDQSTSTRENIAFSYEIIKKHGLNESIAIATNEFHEYRAGKIADSIGLKHGAISGNTALWLLPTYYARELLAILYEWVF